MRNLGILLELNPHAETRRGNTVLHQARNASSGGIQQQLHWKPNQMRRGFQAGSLGERRKEEGVGTTKKKA